MQFFIDKISTAISSVFGRLRSIPHPDLTPENWCREQPCMKIRVASKEVVISQPLSSFWVYFLGLSLIGVGLYFVQIQDGEKSRLWWGVSLLLMGIGALLAGTSYQAFGYEIKCSGKKVCSWTSWWEVVFLMFHQISVNAMLVGIAYSCTSGTFQVVLLCYALVSSLVFVILICIGGMVPIKYLITFEFMVWVSAPVYFFFCIFNTWRYYMFRDSMDLVLLGSWILLFGTMVAYWIYGKLGITKKIWARGIWFSENDVLHVLLIFWITYIATIVAHRIKDYTVPIF